MSWDFWVQSTVGNQMSRRIFTHLQQTTNICYAKCTICGNSCFFFLLRKPLPVTVQIANSKKEDEIDEKTLVDFREKIFYIRHLLMVPLTIIYISEYFINQGLVGNVQNDR
jgi:hypothetical protein